MSVLAGFVGARGKQQDPSTNDVKLGLGGAGGAGCLSSTAQ